jgi:hypothetical protein
MTHRPSAVVDRVERSIWQSDLSPALSDRETSALSQEADRFATPLAMYLLAWLMAEAEPRDHASGFRGGG